jgi:L,D-peptidoglycan transpeptidase YkuD (ErfK/YbiS/YcfS/YnhG family)
MVINIALRFTYFGLILSMCLSISCTKINEDTPILPSCRQLVLVITDSLKSTKGDLFYFERDSTTASWILVNNEIPIALGRSGLGWGIGLHNIRHILGIPLKEEGDGRSPAGVFGLSHVFGYKPADQMINLRMPYISIIDMTECIDDVSSKYYNQIVSRDEIEKLRRVDWQSSEKMGYAGIYYELGVVVAHNNDPIGKGSGSCIFLHNWSNPNETSAGCTIMDPLNMKEIVYWLDEVKNPILVQLTRRLYIALFKNWKLPELNNIANTK